MYINDTEFWLVSVFCPPGTGTNVSSPAVAYRLYDDAVVNERLIGCVTTPDAESRWKVECSPAKSSPVYGKLSKACRSICWDGVYKAAISGLFDLPVASDLAEDIWYDI